MDVIASLDQGTQSTRVFIYDEHAAPIASHHVEFKQHRQKAGYALQRCRDATRRCDTGTAYAGGLSMILRKFGRVYKHACKELWLQPRRKLARSR